MERSAGAVEEVHTCAQKAVFVVEGVDSGTVANQGRGLESLLIFQLHHAKLSLQVNALPVRRVLNGLINPPSQLPTHTLPHLSTGADHLEGSRPQSTFQNVLKQT